MSWHFFLNYVKSFGVSEVNNNWCWESWSHPLGPKTMTNEELSSSPKMNPNSY